MASLKKRGNYYSIVFKKRIDGKPIRKTYALGVKYKDIARDKQREYEKLYQSGEIDPFDPAWNLKEYEEAQEEANKPTYVSSYFIQDLKEQFLKSKSHTS
ncbi:MAG: hypothetical protein R3281_18565, partial [Balneolaceae bacterium]|nr:hypothetical protein [Balneolaceae bacterium]